MGHRGERPESNCTNRGLEFSRKQVMEAWCALSYSGWCPWHSFYCHTTLTHPVTFPVLVCKVVAFQKFIPNTVNRWKEANSGVRKHKWMINEGGRDRKRERETWGKYQDEDRRVRSSCFPQILYLNPLSPELNPICCLLALLWAHHFLHVSRIKIKSLTLRLLVSYTYGAPILDVSRSHTTTQHSR